MNSIELKRVEFRHYLEKSGVMDALSAALIKLYDEPTKPIDPVAFVRRHFRNSDEIIDETSSETGDIEANDAPKSVEIDDSLVKKLQSELDLARKEILSLRSTLETMINSTNEPKQPSTQQISVKEATKFYEQFIANEKYAGSLLKKYLTEDLFMALARKKTKRFENTIMDCIRGGEYVTDEKIGLLAADAECYNEFGEIFELIVKDLRQFDGEYMQPDCNWGDTKDFIGSDLNGEFIALMQITCRRSLVGVPFVISMTPPDFEECLKKIEDAIKSSQHEEQDNGTAEKFYKLSEILENEDLHEDFQSKHLEFRTKHSENYPLWPNGRGVYVNNDNVTSILILINEEDHVKCAVSQTGGDFAKMYQSLVSTVENLQKSLEFDRHEQFGWLTMNPRNVGTAVRCDVYLKPIKNIDHLNEICEKHNLTQRKLTEAESVLGAEFVISNKSSFGKNEFETVKGVYDGISEIISNATSAPEMQENIDSEENEVLPGAADDFSEDQVEVEEIQIDVSEGIADEADEDGIEENLVCQEDLAEGSANNDEEEKIVEQVTKFESTEEGVTVTETIETKTVTESNATPTDREEIVENTNQSPDNDGNDKNRDSVEDQKADEEIIAHDSIACIILATTNQPLQATTCHYNCTNI